MKLFFLFCCIMTVLLSVIVFSNSAISKEINSIEDIKDGDVYELASDFARCSAFFESYAKFYNEMGKPDRAEYALGWAKGAELAATKVANKKLSGEKTLEFVKSSIDAQRPLMEDMRKSYDSAAFDEEAEKCSKLMPLQDKITEESLKQQYGFTEK